MAAVARSRELDHKQEQSFAPNRGLLEEYTNIFNEPQRRVSIDLLVLTCLVSESNEIFQRGTLIPLRYASNKYHQLCPEEIGHRSDLCTQRSRSLLPCSTAICWNTITAIEFTFDP